MYQFFVQLAYVRNLIRFNICNGYIWQCKLDSANRDNLENR